MQSKLSLRSGRQDVGRKNVDPPLDGRSGVIISVFRFTVFAPVHAAVLPPCRAGSAGPFLGARVAPRTRRRITTLAPRVIPYRHGEPQREDSMFDRNELLLMEEELLLELMEEA